MLSLRPTNHFNTLSIHQRPINDAPASDLPSELILDIFELGAAADRNTAISLLAATSWSRKLLLPRMYESVVLESWSRVDQFKQTMRSQHRDEIRNSVKRLSVAVGEYPVADILSACQSITSLTASSSLFRRQGGCYLPPNLIYNPAVLSPHLTHLVIHGPTYHVQDATLLPRTITHLVFKDDAPIAGYSLKAVLSLPRLTHLAFKVSQQALPFAPDPSPRVSFLLDTLFAKQVPSSDATAMTPTTASSQADESFTPISLIVVMLSPNVDTRIVETLVNYRVPGALSIEPSARTVSESENCRPRLNILREHQAGWWSQAEWAQSGGDEQFWNRVAETID